MSLLATERYVSYRGYNNNIKRSQTSLLVYADTTDVQKIIVVPLEESNAFAVQCIFLSGSIAQGCKVILMGEFDSITVNLTKNGLCAADTIEANLPVSNYSAVFGHDIESDGSVGTLAIHGTILRNASSIARCMPSGLTPNPSKSIGCFGSKEPVII